MIKKILAAVALVAFAPSAQAFLDPPYITPQHPAVGEVVSVAIRGGVCDGVGTIPGYPQITRQGNMVRIVLWGVHATDPILCNIPIATVAYPVGAYPPGSYVVQMDRNYQDDLGGIVTQTLGVMSFKVASRVQQPIALPAVGIAGLGVLGLVIFLVTAYKLGRDVSAADGGTWP